MMTILHYMYVCIVVCMCVCVFCQISLNPLLGHFLDLGPDFLIEEKVKLTTHTNYKLTATRAPRLTTKNEWTNRYSQHEVRGPT